MFWLRKLYFSLVHPGRLSARVLFEKTLNLLHFGKSMALLYSGRPMQQLCSGRQLGLEAWLVYL